MSGSISIYSWGGARVFAISSALEHFHFYSARLSSARCGFSSTQQASLLGTPILRKSHVGSGCFVCTRSENAVAVRPRRIAATDGLFRYISGFSRPANPNDVDPLNGGGVGKTVAGKSRPFPFVRSRFEWRAPSSLLALAETAKIFGHCFFVPGRHWRFFRRTHLPRRLVV